VYTIFKTMTTDIHHMGIPTPLLLDNYFQRPNRYKKNWQISSRKVWRYHTGNEKP